MALADYFQRNAQAAAALVQGFDAALLEAKLGAECVGVVYDASVERSAEGQAAIDLCLRLLSRLYPKLVVVGLAGVSKGFTKRLHALALGINPQVEISGRLGEATRVLIFGQTRVAATGEQAASAWYVGSDGWIAKLSKAAPVGSGATENPFGAGAAACIAASNVFRAVFAAELGGGAADEELTISVLDLRPVTRATKNPPLKDVNVDGVHLVGAGAIGNGVVWALSKVKCVGTMRVVDHETLSDSNLQRYVMAAAGDRGKQKSTLAAEWLAAGARNVRVMPHAQPWGDYATTVEARKFDVVLSAVDSAKARIEIQASLPRAIFNGWTQRGEAGVSRHHFLGEMACLACLYLPTGKAENEDVLIARALRLGEDDQTLREVRQRLQQAIPTERAFLERIAAAAGLGIEKLEAFEGRPLRELYVEAVCGGRVMEFHQAALEAKAEVPMGFQSALAGILLAAELARPTPIAETVTQIDMLSSFPERPSRMRGKTLSPQCLCADEDFIEVFRAKYGG